MGIRYRDLGQISVDERLYAFATDEALPDSGVEPEAFWQGLGGLIARFSAENKALMDERIAMRARIDAYVRQNRDLFEREDGRKAYEDFLRDIGYLVPTPPATKIVGEGIDREIARLAGPQLVVPANNARYALNAVNARWGSLYDALYGSDVLGEPPKGAGCKTRESAVIAYARDFLDQTFPLARGSHAGARGFSIAENGLTVRLASGESATLADPKRFVGYAGAPSDPEAIVFLSHGLHVIVHRNKQSRVGRMDEAGISDVEVEAALTTIIDLEDSVAVVDGEDKAEAYRTWLGLMKGDLRADFMRGGTPVERSLAPDRLYLRPDGQTLRLKARALMFIRNVGHFMQTPAVRDASGEEVYEGLVDAAFSLLIARHDLARARDVANAAHRSIYVVKPKMQGPKEVDFANRVFGEVERFLGLRPHTAKFGLMDEARRMSATLEASIAAAPERVCFVNTGFLDRTADEIHASLHQAPMAPVAGMKAMEWFRTYEQRNVAVALDAGFAGKAQIGKGMWVAPDRMKAMLDEKGAELDAGATTAWVPSPTAATLHALHYHRHHIEAAHKRVRSEPIPPLSALLRVPFADPDALRPQAIQDELEDRCQRVLGYVARWVDQGVGCSKILDRNGVALMEDRATLRVSAQAIANWLHHKVISAAAVRETLSRMAKLVDQQNVDDPNHVPLSGGDSEAFKAANDLIFHGAEQPSGYVEPLLHAARRRVKAAQDLSA